MGPRQLDGEHVFVGREKALILRALPSEGMSDDISRRLEGYLAKPLPPFAPGTADCGALVAGWVNEALGREALFPAPYQTHGERIRTARNVAQVCREKLLPLGFRLQLFPDDSLPDGTIVIVEHKAALTGTQIAIWKDGKALTRMDSQDLFIVQDPHVLYAFLLPAEDKATTPEEE